MMQIKLVKNSAKWFQSNRIDPAKMMNMPLPRKGARNVNSLRIYFGSLMSAMTNIAMNKIR